MFYFIRSVIFDTFRPMYVTSECCMTLLPTILALGYAWVYICISDCYNMASYIEIPIDETFSFKATLSIPNANPYDSHV